MHSSSIMGLAQCCLETCSLATTVFASHAEVSDCKCTALESWVWHNAALRLAAWQLLVLHHMHHGLVLHRYLWWVLRMLPQLLQLSLALPQKCGLATAALASHAEVSDCKHSACCTLIHLPAIYSCIMIYFAQKYLNRHDRANAVFRVSVSH